MTAMDLPAARSTPTCATLQASALSAPSSAAAAPGVSCAIAGGHGLARDGILLSWILIATLFTLSIYVMTLPIPVNMLPSD